MNNEIMALRKEIAELKAMIDNLVISSSVTPMDHSSLCDNTKKPKISLLEKFDGMRSKFHSFVMQVQLFLHMYPYRYYNNSTQVGFVDTLLLESALSWFAPLMEKRSPLLEDMELFMKTFHTAFRDSDRERVAETKMQSLCQGSHPLSIYAAKF